MEAGNSICVSLKNGLNGKRDANSREKGFATHMKKTLDKLKSILCELEKEHGQVLVFVLFLRGESPARWDLVIAAPWLDSGNAKSYHLVAKKVQNLLSSEEIIQLSRVVILDADDPVVAFLQDSYSVPNGTFKNIENCEPFSQRFNFTIRKAYLLRCIHATHSKEKSGRKRLLSKEKKRE